MSTVHASGNEIADAILDAARNAGLDADDVEGLTRLSGGASKETWAFDLNMRDGRRSALVLRRQPHGQRFATQGLESVLAEADVAEIARQAGVPVPPLAFRLPAGSAGGDGFAMERIEGETIGFRVLKSPDLAGARATMAQQCGKILARLHAVESANDLALSSLGSADALAALDERYRKTGSSRPVFEFALRWLADHLPTENKRVLVHGDFRNGNFIVGPDGIRAVLDWELAHIGAPASDLAWLCVPSWRFQRPDLPVGGIGEREELLHAYEDAGGDPIDPAELHAWEVFQILNWGVMCAGVAAKFADGVRTIEGAIIARRASETEFDLMQLLAGDHPAWEQWRNAG